MHFAVDRSSQLFSSGPAPERAAVKPRMRLGGDLATDTWAALEDLSSAFRVRRRSPSTEPTLADGEVGIALAHAALEDLFPGRGHAEASRRSLAHANAALPLWLGPGLFEGITGVAWATRLLTGAANPEVDRALGRLLRRPRRWDGQTDLADGLVGIGVHALEGADEPLVALVVQRLAEAAEKRPEGITWRWRPRFAPRRAWRTAPPVWNLGLAHGVPGVIAFLGRVCGMGIRANVARPLLRGAVSWLLAQEITPPADSSFGRLATSADVAEPARLAWCYGDAGVAAALLVAGRDAAEPDCIDHGLRIARHAARRPVATSAVVDPSICHGAAGLGHAFHRMYEHTADPELARAARAWLRRALAMRDGGRFGGFSTLRPGAGGAIVRRSSAGLVLGAAGITLALAAAVRGLDRAGWDRSLLLSGNPS